MKIHLASCLAAAFAAAFSYAGPTDDVAAAASKLAEAPNYGWTVTTEFANSQFPAMPSNGVTEKGGYTVVTTAFNGRTIQTVVKGDQMVMQNQEGTWLTMDEMRQQFGGGGGAVGARGGGRGRMMMGGGGAMNFSKDTANYVAKMTDVKVVEGAIVGTLSAEDVAPSLMFGRGAPGGQTPPAPKNASGSVKFWLKDGAITKYAVNVKGTVTTPNGDEREIDLTTTVEIKNLGTTTVVVPEEAKKKLSP
jgi:hypothetical protein